MSGSGGKRGRSGPAAGAAIEAAEPLPPVCG